MPQRVVDALCRTRASVELLAFSMLPSIKEVRIRPVTVRINQSTTPFSGNFLPKPRQVVPFSGANHPSDDLPCVARNRCPKPQIALLADTKFVEFEGIVFSVEGGVGLVGGSCSLFLSTL